MGQKVNPIGFRLGLIYQWTSRWTAEPKKYREYVKRDLLIRDIIRRELQDPGLEDIEIHRVKNNETNVIIRTSRPGVVIGVKGQNIRALEEKINRKLQEMGVSPKEERVVLRAAAVENPELSAQVVANSIAHQIERQVLYRRAMKRAIQQALEKGAKGTLVEVVGRLPGAEIARRVWYQKGRIPRHTIRAHIDYGFAEAWTKYGRIGVKVWIYHGDVDMKQLRPRWTGGADHAPAEAS